MESTTNRDGWTVKFNLLEKYRDCWTSEEDCWANIQTPPDGDRKTDPRRNENRSS